MCFLQLTLLKMTHERIGAMFAHMTLNESTFINRRAIYERDVRNIPVTSGVLTIVDKHKFGFAIILKFSLVWIYQLRTGYSDIILHLSEGKVQGRVTNRSVLFPPRLNEGGLL